MPKFKPNTSKFRMESPLKTRFGRWIMGRKKHVTADGTTVITDKKGRVVKTKTAAGTKTKYKKGNRPAFRKLAQEDKYIMGEKAYRIKHRGSPETL
tara:strand:+ start:526 stop:813 length:288 start_codon:yes stop_codon:yes gene_type:complete